MRRERVYVTANQCKRYWEHAIPVPWPDVHLPNGWHLNPERVPAPVIPATGRTRELEIRCRPP